MNSLLKCIFAFAFFVLSGEMKAQNRPVLTPDAQISLMTVEPGDALYSTFGHSAVRVSDPANKLDRIYNYGTFDFSQPNFYLNFCRGKLLYMLDRESYRSFERGNLFDLRGMREQVLNLRPEQKQWMFDALENNALPENRDYKYDFFFDNCATRIRDVVDSCYGGQIVYDESKVPTGSTMRQLLSPYLASQPWTRLGINLVLGLPCDQKATLPMTMFLPDHMHQAYSGARLSDGTPLVIQANTLPAPAMKSISLNIFSPWLVLSLIASLGLASVFNRRIARFFDPIFWLFIGIMGVLIAFLWFLTDHQATKNNINLLWCWPTHIFDFWKKSNLHRKAAGAGAFLTLITWPILPQALPMEALPIIALIALKGWVQPWWENRKKT